MAKSFSKFKKDAKKDVKIATHDKPLFKSVPATGVRGDQPANDLLIRTIENEREGLNKNLFTISENYKIIISEKRIKKMLEKKI